MDPHALNIKGSTQPEVFADTVTAMAVELSHDAARFWSQALATDGPIDIWAINGERFLYNGNHRYHAAVKAKVEIPDAMIRIVDRTGSAIVTYPLDQLDWLPGFK